MSILLKIGKRISCALVVTGMLSLYNPLVHAAGEPDGIKRWPSPGASATVSGVITCVANTVTLIGASPTSGVTYAWSGPGGFRSGMQNPETSVPGIYVLIVSLGSSTSTATVMVQQNTLRPGVVAAASGVLTCKTHFVTLSAISAAPGAAYRWTGPGGYVSTEQNPVTTVPGVYTVSVTQPLNGCVSEASVDVVADTDAPAAVTAGVSGLLTCSVTSATLTGSSVTQGVSYRWTGPAGFTSNTQQVPVNIPGAYTLTATKTSSGCTAIAGVTVLQDVAVPAVAAITASPGFILDCNNSTATLSCSSPTPGATQVWTGPDGYIANGPLAIVTAPGTYVFTATGSNGCTTRVSRDVLQDKLDPPSVVAGVSGVLTCSTPAVTLYGISNGAVSYQWSGPSGFTSTLQNPVVSIEGTYTLTVASPAGCTGTANIMVQRNTSLPAGVTATASGTLGCARPSVTLQGTTSTVGATYHWIGPDAFESTARNPETNIPGEYILKVTNPITGCTAQTGLTVHGEVCNSKK